MYIENVLNAKIRIFHSKQLNQAFPIKSRIKTEFVFQLLQGD